MLARTDSNSAAYKGSARHRRYGRVELKGAPLELEDLSVIRLSEKNCKAVLQSLPTATYVGGFHDWIKLGRCVRKGEKALYIFAPIYVKDDGGDTLRFKAVPVFDISQTCELQQGAGHAE